MRSYQVYGIRDGGSEQFVTTVHNSAEGQTAHQQMKAQGYYDEIVVRDVMGNKRIHRSLRSEQNFMSA